MTETSTYPRFRWFVLLTLITATAAQSVIMIGFAPLIGIIAKNLGIGLALATGTFMGLWNLVAAISAVGGGFFCDRFGIVKSLFWGLVLLIVPCFFMPYFGKSFEGALIIRLIQALSVGPINAATAPVAALWFPSNQRGLVTGAQGMSTALGVAIGFIAAPALFGASGNWQMTMVWLNVISLAGILMTLAIPFGPKEHIVSRSTDVHSASLDEKGDFRLACRQPVTWVGVGIVFCLSWLFVAFNDLTPGYLAIAAPVGLGYGPMLAGKFMMAMQITFMIGAIVTGFAMQKIFRNKAWPTILTGFSLFAVFALSIMWSPVYSNYSVLVACLMLAGFFEAWVNPNAFAFIALHYPPHITGKLIGLWLGIGIFGGSIGVLCGSLALHHTGNYHLSIIIVGIVAVVGCILSFFLKPPSKAFVVDRE